MKENLDGKNSKEYETFIFFWAKTEFLPLIVSKVCNKLTMRLLVSSHQKITQTASFVCLAYRLWDHMEEEVTDSRRKSAPPYLLNIVSQQIFKCSKLTIETLQKDVENVQS